jgi:tetraacyldisaccharide 4'-kinase
VKRPPAFWQHNGPTARLLAPLGGGVALAARLRRRWTHARSARVPVVCVGNVTVGGGGKTPVALDLGRRLRDAGHAVHFLTRGYGGHPGATPLRVEPSRHDVASVGDEALLLARVAPTWVAPDRVAGAAAAEAAGAEVLVLDDGFQNPRLAADLALLVLDGGAGFGNGRVMPAGPLREPVDTALTRAGTVVRLGPDRAGLDARLKARGVAAPLTGAVRPDGETAWLEGARVMAFAGLARPEKLFDTLSGLGADLVARVAFPDHHRYTDKDLHALASRAAAANARLVTTEKDWVRLPAAMRARVTPLPVRVVWDTPEAVTRLLQESLFPDDRD